jgi:glyoxylase-like metal-dependent hydrolase (beta-lactamase superfamily II)
MLAFEVPVVPRGGHTDSDVSLELDDPQVVFCGDLVWNGMFPNYMDALPSRLSQEARLLRALEAEVWIPGHGDLADAASVSWGMVDAPSRATTFPHPPS